MPDERSDSSTDLPRAGAAANNAAGDVSGVSLQAAVIGNATVRQDNRTTYVLGGAGRMEIVSPSWTVDRAEEYARLWGAARDGRDTVSLIALSGPRGIGKTTLAESFLHDVRHHEPNRLPGGLRRVDLGARDLELAVADLLCDMGLYPSEVPLTLGERCARYRVQTSERGAMGLLLDDAPSIGAVEALLPAAPGSIVVVTVPGEPDIPDPRSRPAADARSGPMHHLPLRPLPLDHGVELLRVRATARARAFDARAPMGPAALRAIVASSDRSPLTLNLLAAGDLEPPQPSAEPAEIPRGLDSYRPGGREPLGGPWRPPPPAHPQPDDTVPDAGGRATVAEAVDAAYRSLPGDAQELLCFVAWHPEGDFGAHVALAAGGPDDRAGACWAALVEAGLLTRSSGAGEPRYRLPRAVRDRVRVWPRDPAAARAAATDRICAHYLDHTRAAHAWILPGRWLVEEPETDPAPAFGSREQAESWLERERAVLARVVRLAFSTDRHGVVWRLCEVLWALYFPRSYYADWIVTHELAVSSAERLGADASAALARMRVQLARPYLDTKDYDRAHTHTRAGLEAARGSGHTLVTLTALEAVGDVQFERGEPAAARRYYTEALQLAEASGDPRAVVVERQKVARCDLATGHLEQARTTLETVYSEALRLPTRDPYNEGRIRTTQGELARRMGDAEGALAHYAGALETFRTMSAGRRLADVLVLRADVLESTGRVDAARGDLGEAHAIYERIASPRAAEIVDRLAANRP